MVDHPSLTQTEEGLLDESDGVFNGDGGFHLIFGDMHHVHHFFIGWAP
jgi:hypothetical protein